MAESKWVAPYLKTPKVQAINKAAAKVVDSLSMLSDIYEQTPIEKKLFLKAHQELIEKHPERYSFMGPLEFGKINPIDQDKFNPELPSISQGPSLHSKDYNPLIKSGQDKDFEYFFDEQGRQYMKPRHETALQTNKSYDLSKEGFFTI